MTNFANELAERLSSHESYWEKYWSLQSAGAFSTLPLHAKKTHDAPSKKDVITLLYCASVFSQADNDKYKTMAQSIALNSILVNKEQDVCERVIRILTELGNFPSLAYAEDKLEVKSLSLFGLLQQRISRELNAVTIGNQRFSLTDYQKDVWNSLSKFKALAVSAPTSAGKSFLVIEHMCRQVVQSDYFVAVYIAPTRALLSEVHQTVAARLKEIGDVRISVVPSANLEKKPKQVFILTQERLQVLLATTNVKLNLIIVDEAQNISDGARGMILQDCLEQAVARNKETGLIMLAPGARGFPEAARIIGIPSIEQASTVLSPVLQNRILVNKVAGKNELQLQLLSTNGRHPLGLLSSNRGFDIPETRLASVALELGSEGGSLVYAVGPSDAEKVALQLAQDRIPLENHQLNDLAAFVEEHIHPEYKLASMIRRGIAFHYGKMPTLLREALESAFKSGALQFLVCTTTLFQGINLPARNVFINTPTRGKGASLDAALLWNFAGRAGRMKKDIVGNVFLVDYDQWPDKPLNNFVRFQIKSAFKATLTESYDQVINALSGKMPVVSPQSDTPTKVRASAGLLIAHAAKGDIKEFAARVLEGMSEEKLYALTSTAEQAAVAIDLPESILTANWMIDPFGLKRLHERIVKKIKDNDWETLIPINPHEKGSGKIYASIFTRMLKHVYGQKGNFGGYVSMLAIPWMKGVPYPEILSKAIRRERDNYERKIKAREGQGRARKLKYPDANKIIKDAFDIIEDVVRFQFVQLGKAYIDLLLLALRDEGREDMVGAIFDFSMALELGIATESGKAYVELGLSRIAASALEKQYPNTRLSISQAREWLWNLNIAELNLSAVIVDEIRRLGLLKPEAVAI